MHTWVGSQQIFQTPGCEICYDPTIESMLAGGRPQNSLYDVVWIRTLAPRARHALFDRDQYARHDDQITLTVNLNWHSQHYILDGHASGVKTSKIQTGE